MNPRALLNRVAAINHQIGTRNDLRVLTYQIQNGRRDFVRLRETANRNLLFHLLAECTRPRPLAQRRFDDGRRDGIDRDPVGSPLDGKNLGHGNHSSLARAIRDVLVQRDDCSLRSDVNYSPTAKLLHDLRNATGQEERRP